MAEPNDEKLEKQSIEIAQEKNPDELDDNDLDNVTGAGSWGDIKG